MNAPLDVAGILERAGADPNAPEGSQAWALAQVGSAFGGLVAVVKQCASECAECDGTGTKHVRWYFEGIENDGERECKDCADIRAALAAVGGVK